ncbi:hypothetical protein ACFC6L_06635 [Kitasatospora phosalacinea]|uniref:hypothetical protein n=1 Tax=Kitasatospora phosalacinea TaxID=2065 RepID=UPI0035D74ADA
MTTDEKPARKPTGIEATGFGSVGRPVGEPVERPVAAVPPEEERSAPAPRPPFGRGRVRVPPRLRVTAAERRPVLALVLVAGLLLTVSVAVLQQTPEGRARHRAYAAATACRAGHDDGECLGEVPLTVTGKDDRRADPRLDLLREDGRREQAFLPDEDGLYRTATAGDRLTGVYWRHELVELRRGAEHHPTGGIRPRSSGVLPFTLPLGLAAAVGAVLVELRVRRRHG